MIPLAVRSHPFALSLSKGTPSLEARIEDPAAIIRSW